MIQRAREFAARHTKSDVMGMRSVIIAVLLTAFISTSIFAILNISRTEMLILSGVLLAAIFFSYIGYHVVGSWSALMVALAALSLMIYRNSGIRDTGMVAILTVLIAAGLLAGKTGTLVIGSLLILEVGIYASLEMQGVVVNKFSHENSFSDYMTVSIAIALITTLQWLVIGRLSKTIQNAEREIKDRQRVEEKLRDAEARYRNLLEKIPLVVYIAEPGSNGTWDYVSPQITNLTGYSPEEWLNDAGLWNVLVHPDDRDQALEAEIKALREGNMPRMEYRLKTRDGRYIWIYDESILVLGTDQHVLVQGFLLDITTRKLAEEQLKIRLAELQAIHGVSESLIQKTDLQKLIYDTGEQIRLTFRASNVLIAVHDPNTNLIQFPYDFQDNAHQKNQPIQFGEGMTTKIMEMKKPLVIHENWEEETRKLNAIFTNSLPIKSSVSVPIMTNERVFGAITLENSEREYAFSGNDVRLLSTIAANLAVALEKTRLQESLKQELEVQENLIRELEQKNEELERFTYTASHDLKAPLITIRGYLGYLEQDANSGNTDRLRADIRRITDATVKMQRLLTELLELSKVGRVVNEKNEVPFETIVAEALRRVEGLLVDKNISVNIGRNLPSVYVDRERIIEVIQNLVDNAIKFMGDQPHPQIDIDHITLDGQTTFYVRDNGIGIRKSFQGKIFGLFDKLDPESDGTGVGLALVKRIIEVHGGKIWVESDEGSGATFYFTLSKN